MANPFAQRHTVTGLEFPPSFISSKEANTKLPKVIISVTQVSCSMEARQNSLRIWKLSCACVQCWENEQFLLQSLGLQQGKEVHEPGARVTKASKELLSTLVCEFQFGKVADKGHKTKVGGSGENRHAIPTFCSVKGKE